MNTSLTGKKPVLIVSGATGNLGKAVVEKFINENYLVIGSVMPGDNTDFGYPEDSFKKIPINLLNEEDSGSCVNQVISDHGSIEAAVFTVGGFAMGNIEKTTASDIEKQYKLNFETAYNIARPVFLQMIKQDYGRIFLIGSRPGLNAKHGKGMVAYTVSKSLIFRLAEIMNDEAKGKNVVTSVVVPSTIDTPQNRKSMPDADFSKWVSPEMIAEVIYFYCLEKSSALREPVIKVYNLA